jgi:hypothetical protein
MVRSRLHAIAIAAAVVLAAPVIAFAQNPAGDAPADKPAPRSDQISAFGNTNLL